MSAKRLPMNLRPCRNMSSADRITRVLVGLGLLILGPVGLVVLDGGVVYWFFIIFGALNVIAGLCGWCFMYSIVGLKSVQSPEDDNDDLSVESTNFTYLRNRVALGFGAIVFALSLLFTLESINSARDVARSTLMQSLHESTLLMLDEITDLLDQTQRSDRSLGEALSSLELDRALYHFREPYLVYLGYDRFWVRATKNISPQKEALLFEHLDRVVNATDQKTQPHSIALEHESNHFFSDDDHLLEFSVDEAQFIATTHHFDYPALGQMTLLVGRETEAYANAVSTVFSRLAISSVIVFWLAIWGGLGVAYFMWRYIQRANDRVVRLASTDPRTGLPNERALKELMSNTELFNGSRDLEIVAAFPRNLSEITASVTLPIVNKMLRQLGSRLKTSCAYEHYLAAMSDGTLIMIAPGESLEQCEQFKQILSESIWVDNYQFSLEPTWVQASFPLEISDFESLRTVVSNLINNAVRLNLNYLRYDESLIESSNRTLNYAAELRRAIDAREFELYLQPKVDLTTRSITSAEALIRWNHPTDGLLAPGAFLTVVDRSNSRSDFACFVISESARLAHTLMELGLPLAVSFNLNAGDLFDPRVQQMLVETAKEHQLKETAYLKVELTEHQSSLQTDRIREVLRLLKWIGYQIALDDFGTGMSSLSYLHELPIDEVKIDRSFTEMLIHSPSGASTLAAMLLLTQGVSCSVIVEGVETEEQAESLEQLGYQSAQGYLFSRPVPFEEFIRLAAQQKPDSKSEPR